VVKASSVALTLVTLLGGVLLSAPAYADPACITAYEQTQTLRKDGKPVAAKAQAAICARAECPALLTKDCTRWLAELEGVIPSVTFEARMTDAKTPAGTPRTDVRVKMDGAALTEKLDGKPVPVEPGSHVFVFEAEGAAPLERTVVVKEGEKNKKVAVTLAAAGAEPDRGRAIPLGVWIFGGASVVAFATSAVFAIDGFGKKSDLEQCKPRCAAGDVDAMSSSFTIADVALGAGVAAGAAALYLFFTRPETEGARASGAATAKPFTTSPFAAPLPGGGAVGVTAQF
jgi:hypothetical protein